MSNIIPTTIKAPLYVIAKQYEWEDKPTITISGTDMSLHSNHVVLATYTHTTTIPIISDEQYNQMRIDALKDSKTRIQAATQVEVDDLEAEIQNLLALPMGEQA